MIEKIKNLTGTILKPDGSSDGGIFILRIFTGYLMLQNHGLSKITSTPLIFFYAKSQTFLRQYTLGKQRVRCARKDSKEERATE